jgi:hypothetical protein
MESVQKKNSIVVTIDDVSHIVNKQLHELNPYFRNALDLQLLP